MKLHGEAMKGLDPKETVERKMIVRIDENYRIRSDEHNFMLEKKRASKRGDQQRWSTLCYCKSLDHVLDSVKDEKLRNLDEHTLNELSRLLHTLTQEIKAIGERCVDLWGRTE